MKLTITSVLLMLCISANATDRCDKVEQAIIKFQEVHDSGEDVSKVEGLVKGESGKMIASLISSLVLTFDEKTDLDKQILMVSVKTGCILGEAIKEQSND